MKSIAILSLAVLDTVSSRMSIGKCPEPENVTNLDKARYAGMWYGIERDPMTPMLVSADCNYKKFTVDSNGDLDLWYQAYYWTMMFSYGGIGGKMYCEPGNKKTCEGTMESFSTERSPISVLATDYDNYAISFRCSEMMGFVRNDYIQISGRETTMSDAILAEAKRVIAQKLPDIDIDSQVLYKTKQGGDCKYDVVKNWWNTV